MTKEFGQLIWPQVIALVILAIFTLLKTFSPKKPETSLMESFAIRSVGLSCCLPTGLLGPLISAINMIQTRMEFWLCNAGTAVVALGHLSLAMYWYNVLSIMEMSKMATVFGAWFILLYLLAALSYYASMYDPTGMFKPSWANQLG